MSSSERSSIGLPNRASDPLSIRYPGRKVPRLARQVLINLISGALGIPPTTARKGSTVLAEFLDAVTAALGAEQGSNAYRKLEACQRAVGEVYDLERDSSERHGRRGGNTIKNHGLRKLLRGITETPYCFIFNEADHPDSDEYRDVPGESYGYDNDVSGRQALDEAGAGNRVGFYRTHKATNLKRHYVACAVIDEIIEEEPKARWRVRLADYTRFPRPVPAEAITIEGRNLQHGITEITYATFCELLSLGGIVDPAPIPASLQDERADAVRLHDVQHKPPMIRVDVPLVGDPAAPPPEGGPVPKPQLPTLTGGHQAGEQGNEDSPNRRELDRETEQVAVRTVIARLSAEGWELTRDRQKDRCGYDLEFQREGQILEIEVKGIRGSDLRFNMTGLEWAQAQASPNFRVLALTNALDPEAAKIHVLTRAELNAMAATITQLRLS